MARRFLLFLFLLHGWIFYGYAQHLYVLDGLTVINCQPGTQLYTIDTDIQMGATDWEIDPSTGANILSSSIYSILIEFTLPGDYTLTSESYPADGSANRMDILFITVNTPTQVPEIAGCYEQAQPNTCYKVCEHSTSTIFTDVPEVTITGASSYTLTPNAINITWGLSGNGNVLFNQGPCEINLCFDILPEPIAAFNASPPAIQDTITVCTHQQIFFENKSLNGLTYTWDFGDGDKSESHLASHAYGAEGYYPVTLTAHGVCECIDEASIIVKVLNEAAPQLDCINSICPGSRQRYTASTNGCSTFFWDVSDNGTIVAGGEPTDDYIEVIWHSGPEGIIELQVEDCLSASCVSTSIFRIPVISPDGPVEGDASVCSGETVTYTAPYYPGTTYKWTVGPYGEIIGDNTLNQVVVRWNEVTTSRNSRITVRYENCTLDCEGLDVLNVSITPYMYLDGELQICEKSTSEVFALAGFDANPVPAEVQWHLENESGQVVYSTAGMSTSISYTYHIPPGIYTWVATNSSGTYCNTEALLKVQVTPLPASPLGITGELVICPGLPYGFNINAGGVYTTNWMVTDGNTDFFYTGQAIEHTFGVTPPYRVEALHQDIQFPACVSEPVSIELTPAVISDFSGADQACLYTVERYTAPDFPGIEMEWEIIPTAFGEIKKLGLNQIEVFWTQPGNATLRLTSCGQVVEKTITIFDKPIVNANYPPSLCENETAIITTDQPLLTHRWINANQQSIGAANTITLGPGTFGVAVIDENGCTDKRSFTIDSLPAPFVFISTPDFLSYCSSIPPGVEITANTPGNDYIYQWYLDNTMIGSGGPVLPVTAFGTYYVEVTNQYGCRAVSDAITFTDCCLNGTCLGDGEGLPLGCTLLSFDFNLTIDEASCITQTYTPDMSNIVPGSISWRVFSASTGLLELSNEDSYTYTYPAPGYYHVLVTGLVNGYPYDAVVCGHYSRSIVRINAIADFTHSGDCTGDMIRFEDLSTYLPDESIASWTWSFGDPSSGSANVSNLQNPTHTFGAPGLYQVSLTINMASGCSVSIQKAISIQPYPTLMVEYDALYCENEALSFHLAEELYNIVWNFDDPASGIQNSAQGNNVFHTYSIAGDYIVNVRAMDIYGCLGQGFIETDIFENTLSGDIAVSPDTRICYGDSARLNAPAGGYSWEWNTEETTSEIFVQEAGLYDLIIYDDLHCAYRPPPVFISVNPKPIVILQAREILQPEVYGPWLSSVSLCAGEEFELQVFANTQVNYSWNNGSDQQTIQFTNEGGNMPLPGEHVYTVQAYDPVTGCLSDSASIYVLIHPLPLVPEIILTSGTGCSFNDNVMTITNPETGVSYQWSDGQTGISILAEKAGAYFVIATNPNGCMSMSNTIHVLPSARVDQIPAGCITACDPFTWCLPPLEDVESYAIYKDGVLFYSDIAWLEYFILDEEGVYTIEVTTTNGCTATSDPLLLTLYTGVGSLTVETWLDTNGDMVINAGDVLLPGIPVQIESVDGLHSGQTITNSDGHFVFSDYPAVNYLATIDQVILPGQYIIMIDSINTQIATCDDSVIVQLLLALNCTVTGPDTLVELCPGESVMIGDSLWNQPGTYEMHMISDGGCDSTFHVHITRPDTVQFFVDVWVDVDRDGVVSPQDTLLPGVPVIFQPLPDGTASTLHTDTEGHINTWLDASGYVIRVDTVLLPPGLTGIYIEESLEDSICGLVSLSFLLQNTCLPAWLVLQDSVCTGDSLLFDQQWLTEEGLYSFIHTDPVNHCDTLIDLYLSLYPPPVITGEVAWSCSTMGNIHISIDGVAPFEIVWQGLAGDTLLPSLPEGLYTVYVTDGHQCEASADFNVEAEQPLNFTIEQEYNLSFGDSVFVEIGGDVHEPGLAFIWQPSGLFQCEGCPATWLSTHQDTLINVFITDSAGCVYLLEAIVNVTANLTQNIYIPNVFSPNGDGINDIWEITSALDNVFIEELMVFDRWGTMVFHTSDTDLSSFPGWDGIFKDQQLNPAVFTFIGRMRAGDETVVVLKGDISLVR